MKPTRFRTAPTLQRTPRASAGPPRPELLPARMRGPTAQAKPAPRAIRTPLPARRPVLQRMEWFAHTVGITELVVARDTLLEIAPSVGNTLCHGVCKQREDKQVVELTQLGVKNAYYLPWQTDDVTQATVPLGSSVKYFFTAPLSGCSIWCKYLSKTQIVIRHEARPTTNAHNLHLGQEFGLVFDSHDPTAYGFGDVALTVDNTRDGLVKFAISFLLYAAIAPDGVTFFVQEQRTRTLTRHDNDLTTEQRDLVRERAFFVPIPS